MKILVINFEYPPLGGGGGVATQDIANMLAGCHEVHVITTAHKDVQKTEVQNGVHIHRVSVFGRNRLQTATLFSMGTFVIPAFFTGLRLCKNISFDVINAQFVLPSGVPAVLLAMLFRIPFVLSLIGGDIYDPTKGTSPHKHWFLRVLIRFIASKARICTAISEDTKRRAQELHGISKEIVVTHLGISPSTTSSVSRDVLDMPRDASIAVSIGRLIPRKGYDVMLQAWKDVKNSHLYILGEGLLRNELEEKIDQYGLQNRVHLLGFVSEEKKQQILQIADIYVSAAEHEGFGLVYLEAMEAGLPIVTIAHGGQEDFLHDGVNASFVSSGDVRSFANVVNTLLSDDALRDRMSVRNKEDVKQFYLKNTVKKFEDVLLNACGGNV